MDETRQPQWSLCIKEGEQWRNVGAAWDGEKGIFLKIDEGVTLKGTVMLFPYREVPPGGWRRREWRSGASRPA